MMKKLSLLILAILLTLSVVSAGTVLISPTEPNADDDLKAYVSGEEDTVFDYYWVQDGATYKTHTGKTSTLSASYTDAGETWTVYAYVPESAWYDSYQYGHYSVTIKEIEDNNIPDKISGDVIIEPSSPCDEDDLSGYVEGYEDTIFDYYWVNDGVTYKTQTTTVTTLSDSNTNVGDVWTLYAYVPESAWYDSYLIDSTSVTINDCSEVENHAPKAADIHFTVTEGDIVDVDLNQISNLKNYIIKTKIVQNIETQNVPAYDADDDVLTISYSSLLNVNGRWQTDNSDAGEYTVVGTVSDGIDTTNVNIVITVVEENHAPLATDIHFTVTEGDKIDVDTKQLSSILSYQNYVIRTGFMQSDVIYMFDRDGDTLKVSYDSLLNRNGVWQTSEGDAGVYTVVATVTDGKAITEADITITVKSTEVENICPVVSAEDITVTEGDLAQAVYTATDADGDSLSVSFSDLFNSNGQWQTEVGDAGEYSVVVTVSDGECEANDTFKVIVEEEECTDSDNDGICDEDECTDLNQNGICDEDECTDSDKDGICDEDENNAPVLDDVSDVEVDEGEIVNVCPSATDADRDSLTYTYEGTPGGSFDANGCWTWDTTYHDAGEYDVEVTVSDGQDSDSDSFTVEVNNICDDLNENDICDDEEYVKSNYEGDLLKVLNLKVLNANALSSAYDVSGKNLEVSGSYYVEDNTLYNSAKDNEIKVYLEMSNENSFDARDIQVTFVFNGKTYTKSFYDLDRSEKQSQVYEIAIPEDLETGSYALKVIIENDDIQYEQMLNVDIVNVGDSITVEEEKAIVESLWDKLKSFLFKLF